MIDYEKIRSESGGELRGILWCIAAALCGPVCVLIGVFIAWGMM